MQVVRHLDETKWRRFALDNPRGNVFLTPEMYRAFERTKGFRPGVWAAVDSTDGEIHALMMPVDVTVVGGPARAFTTRTVAFGSVACSEGEAGRTALETLLRHYDRHGGRRTLFTELRHSFAMDDLDPVLARSGYAYEPHLNYLIDLSRPADEIWKSIRSNAQRNVRKARKAGVTVHEAADLDDVRRAYVVLRDVYERIRVPLPDLSLFEATFDSLHAAGMMRVLTARLEDADIAALTLLLHGDTALYWYTGPRREYSEYRASDLLVWHAFEVAKDAGCTVFDFGGGGKPGEEYGVRDFKQKFGGREVEFGRHVRVHAPMRLRVSEFGYERLRGVLSRSRA